MPVRRYSNLVDAQRALWRRPGDPEIVQVLRALSSLAQVIVGRFIPPRGVFKFRTIEEANAHRKAWEQERVDRIRQANHSAK